MPIVKNTVDHSKLNPTANLPFGLRISDIEAAMQDVYDFFYDVNGLLVAKNLQRLDDTMRAANLSGLLSDMLTASVAKHSRTLTENKFFNGHPDLIVKGRYPNDSIQAGTDGIEIKTTRKAGGAVDTHGGRNQWLCVFVYQVDNETEPAVDRAPLNFTEAYLGQVRIADFRHNARGKLGTRTATLHAKGIEKFRRNWIYRL